MFHGARIDLGPEKLCHFVPYTKRMLIPEGRALVGLDIRRIPGFSLRGSRPGGTLPREEERGSYPGATDAERLFNFFLSVLAT